MWKSPSHALTAIAILTAIACSAGGDDGSGPTGSISLSASPSSLTLPQGGSGTVTVTLLRGGGFADPVNVAVTGLPAGVTLSVTPTQLTGATTQATVTVNVANSVPAGTYTATVTATATGIGSATATYALTVTPLPNYSLTTVTAPLTIGQGGSGGTTIAIQRTSFTGPVTLTLDNPPPGITGIFNPNPATDDASALTINVASTVATGSYTLTVKGSATGPGDKTTTIALVVAPPPDYQLSTTSNTVNIPAGATGTTTVNIARTNFTGAVTLALDAPPPGISATFNPVAPTLTSSTATISVAASVAPGTYNVTIKGTATGVPTFAIAGQFDDAAAAGDRTTTVAVSVSPAGNFTISATPGSVSIGVGASGNTSIAVVRTDFTADIALTLFSPPPGITGAFTPATLTGSALQSNLVISVAASVALGNYTITVQGSGASLTKLTAVTLIVTAAAADFTISATPASLSIPPGGNGNTSVAIVRSSFTTDVALTLVSPPTGITGVFTPATLTGTTLQSNLVISVAASVAPGNHTVTVQGAGGSVTKTTTVTVTVTGGAASVLLSMTPNTLTIQQGGSSQATLNAVRTNYTGNITPTFTSNPAGPTLTFNPNPITTGNSAQVTVNVGGSVPAGTYSVTITGASGAAGNPTTTLTITVTAPSGGSNFEWDFCTADGVPLKFWRLSGSTWAEVAPLVVGNITRFAFNISSTSGGVAYTMQASSFSLFNSTRVSQQRSKLREASRAARERTTLTRLARSGLANQVLPLNANFFDTFVQLAQTSELGAYRETCVTTTPTLVSKTFNVSGIGGSETGTLGYGGASANLSSSIPSYNLMVETGSYDWLAAFGPAPGPDWTSYRIGRNEATASGAVNIDRVGATAFTTFPFTVSGGAGGSFWQFIQGFQGSRGFIHVLSIGDILTNSNTGTMRFLTPADRLVTDLVSLQITNLAQGASSFDFRISDNYVGSAPPASGSFALPPAVPAFTVSAVMGAPVPTWSVSGPTPVEFQTAVSSITTSFEGGDGNALYTIGATRAYQTANGMTTSYTLAGPNLPNFLTAWAPTAPITETTVIMLGYDVLGVPTAGTVAIFAVRIQ